MRYRVHIQFIGATSVEVEAEDKDEAIEKALNEAPQNSFGFADYDANEWYVEDEDQCVQELGE